VPKLEEKNHLESRKMKKKKKKEKGSHPFIPINSYKVAAQVIRPRRSVPMPIVYAVRSNEE